MLPPDKDSPCPQCYVRQLTDCRRVDVRLINSQSPPALLAAVRQDLAAIRRTHPGAEPVLALPFFNGWMIGGFHKLSPISMD